MSCGHDISQGFGLKNLKQFYNEVQSLSSGW